MDRVGPILLFILYMVISGWAKQKKAQRKAAEKAQQSTPTQREAPAQPIGESILEQLKREFLAVEDEVPYVEEAIPIVEPEMADVDTAIPSESQFAEGSTTMSEKSPGTVSIAETTSKEPKISLNSILKSYSLVEQGIVMREILGKPRALQDNAEWFYFD